MSFLRMCVIQGFPGPAGIDGMDGEMGAPGLNVSELGRATIVSFEW